MAGQQIEIRLVKSDHPSDMIDLTAKEDIVSGPPVPPWRLSTGAGTRRLIEVAALSVAALAVGTFTVLHGSTQLPTAGAPTQRPAAVTAIQASSPVLPVNYADWNTQRTGERAVAHPGCR